MDTDKFFQEYQQTLLEILKNLLNKLEVTNSLRYDTNDLRQLLKNFRDDWDPILKPKLPSKATITSSIFHEIKKMLNNWHHNQQMEWKKLDKVVNNTITLLEALETECGLFCVPTSQARMKISSSWSKIEKSSDLAFEKKKQIEFEEVVDSSVQPPSNEIIITGFLPSFDETTFFKFFSESLGVSIVSFKKVTADSYQVTLPNPEQLGIALHCNIILYQGKKVSISKVEKKDYFVQLSGVSDKLSEADLACNIEAMEEIVIPNTNIQLNRETATAIIQLQSKAEFDTLVGLRAMRMKGKEIAIAPLEQEAKTQVALFLKTPCTKPEQLGMIWEHHFDFPIDAEEPLKFLDNNTIAVVTLSKQHISDVLSNAIPFRFASKDVTISRYTPYLLKVTIPDDTPKEHIKAAVASVIPADAIVDLAILQPNNLSYLFVKDSISKEKLLSLKTISLRKDNQKQPKNNHTVQNDNNATPTSSPKPEKQIKAVVISPLPEGISTSEIASTLNSAGIHKFFLTVRDGQAFVELFNADHFRKLTEKDFLDLKGKKSQVMPISLESIPHWNIVLSPVPTQLSKDDLKAAAASLVQGGRYGFLTRNGHRVLVPVSDETTYLNVLNKKQVTIKNNLVWILKEDDEEPATHTMQIVPVEGHTLKWLKWKKKKALKNLQLMHQVKIIIPRPKPEKNKTDKPTKQTGKPLKVDKSVKPFKKGKQEKIELTISGPEPGVKAAVEDVKELLSDVVSKPLMFEFGPYEFPLLEIMQQKVIKSTQESEDCIALVNPSKQELSEKDKKLLMKVKFIGPSEPVGELVIATNVLRSSLVSDSTKFDPNHPVPINADDYKDLDIQIKTNDKTGFINVYGIQEDVSSAMDLIKEKLGSSASSGYMVLNFLQAAFIKNYKMAELEEKATSLEVKLSLKEQKLFFKGKFQGIAPFKKFVKKMVEQLRQDQFTKTFDKSAAPLVSNYLQKKLASEKVAISCLRKKTPSDNKLKALTESSLKAFDENSDDDTEDTFSDSQSMDTDPSLEFDQFDDNSNVKSTKFTVELNISILHLDEEKLNLKITDIMNSLRAINNFIRLRESELRAVQKLKTLAGYKGVNIRLNARTKLLVVSGFDFDAVTKVTHDLRKYIEEHTVDKETLPVTAQNLHYLKKKRDQIDLIKTTLGLKYIKFVKEGNKIEIVGNSSQAGRAKEELKELLEGVSTEQFTFSKKDHIDMKEALDLKRDLENQYDAVLKITEKAQGISVMITGKDLSQVKQELEKLKITQQVWMPSNYQQLASIVLNQKKVDLKKFKSEWNLTEVFFVKETENVRISGRNPDDIESAKQALEGVLTQQKITSENITISDMHWAFLSRKDSLFGKKYEEIRSSKTVKIPEPGIRLRTGQLTLRGNSEDVKKVKEALIQLIQNLQAQLKTQFLDLSPSLANELTKDKWRLAMGIFNSTGVYISSPGKEKSRVDIELAGKYFKVQVVEGNILDERTDCIVNAANEQLQHNGGIAKVIATKAGPAMKEACDNYIKQNNRVPTGQAIRTTAGNLSFLGILHAVGPIWIGGQGNEESFLESAVINCLDVAANYNYQSISIPAISSGIFNFPKPLCAKIIVRAVMMYMAAHPNCGINLIRLCDKDTEILSEFSQNLRDQHNFEVTQISSSKEAPPVAYQWLWKENDGSFKPFDPDQNYQIEVAYVKQNHKGKMTVMGDIQKVKNGFTYEIDFDVMTEINTHYRSNPRQIIRKAKEISSVKWQVLSGLHWQSFDTLTSNNLELGYSKKFPSVQIQWNGVSGIVSLAKLQLQVQDKTYAVRRKDRDFEDELMQYLRDQESNDNADQMKATVPKNTTRIQLIGFVADLDAGKKAIEAELKKRQVTQKVTIGRKPSEAELDEFKQHSDKYGVEMSMDDTNVILTGLANCVSNAKADIMGTLLKHVTQQTSYPSNWIPQTKNCELQPIPKNSEEWKTIALRFGTTLSAQITNIERVQNKWLWERYGASKNLLAKKNNGKVNELQLFHGTRGNHPALIYDADIGFDMRYCNSGMWGIAIYFAENASYSNSYAFNSDGTKQIFLTRVTVGDCKHIMPNDSSLRKPPSKAQHALGFAEDYDSVSGDTGGSKVFMIYENGRAYPEYLITYK